MNAELQKKLAVLQELDRSRMAIQRDFSGLQDELNFAKKLENIVRQKPAWWLAGAGFTGFLIATIRAGGRPKPAKRAKGKDKNAVPTPPPSSVTFWGFLIALFKFAFPMVKPFVSAYATKRMADLAFSLGKR